MRNDTTQYDAADEIDRVVRLPQPLVLHGDMGGEFARGEAWMLCRVQAALDAAGVKWAMGEWQQNTRDIARCDKSAGSVANGPVAWAALRDDGEIAWIGYTPEGTADGAGGRRIVPLYRSPTLTDAEREALEFVVDRGHAACGYEQETLRGLLERLK
jgi:hypothetical protein